jgi:hypothetical protein
MSEFLTELDVLKDVSHRLDAAHIPFMLTGSLAMSFYALPLMTRDIDLVVELPKAAPGVIARLFEPDYYVSAEWIADAVRHSTLFNLIHQASVIKVDCIVRKLSRYRIEEFQRRQRVQASGFETWIATKEDLILSKLAWFAESNSERQLADLKNLLPTGFDAAYVAGWVRELGLTESWKHAASG